MPPPTSTISSVTPIATETGPPAGGPSSAIRSTVGAFNGTGMSNIDPLDTSYTGTQFYFQHFDGDLRSSQLRDDSWKGGGLGDSIGATNPANGTSIAATSYEHQGMVTVWYK